MGIGYLPQEASVFRKLSVEDNISAVLEMTKLSKAEQKAKLESLIEEFRLQKVRKNNGDTLSGGERRRTEIARALAVDPKFILLDEPFAGVDPIAVEDIQAIVAKLKYKNIGILITDHNVNETLSICDRAYLLIDGKIFEHGTAEELANNEQVRRLYLGRNFELKRKDYLHDEVREQNSASTLSGKHQVHQTSLVSFSQYVYDRTNWAIAYLNKRTELLGGGTASLVSATDFSDYFTSFNELVASLKVWNDKQRSASLNQYIEELPILDFNKYKSVFKADDSRILSGWLWNRLISAKLNSLIKKLEGSSSVLGKIVMELQIADVAI